MAQACVRAPRPPPRRGTLNVIEACKAQGVGKVVMSSSPSTRFDGKVRPLSACARPPAARPNPSKSLSARAAPLLGERWRWAVT